MRVYAYYPGWPPEARIVGRPSGCLIANPPFIHYRPPVQPAPLQPLPETLPEPEPPPAPVEEPPPAPSTAAAQSPPPGSVTEVPRTVTGRPARLLLTGRALHDAGLHYTAGFNAYWRGDYRSALTHFRAATRLAPRDARFQMYLGLALLASGDAVAGERAIRAGWEQAGSGQTDVLLRAIERVQGPLRQRIEALRPEPGRPATTESIARR